MTYGHGCFISRSKRLFAELRDPLPPVTVLWAGASSMSLNKWEFTGMIHNVLLRDFNGFYMVFWEQAWVIWIYILYIIYIYYIYILYIILYIYILYYIYISFLCGCLIETSIVTLQHESWWVSHALPTSTGNQRWSMVDSTAAWWFVASVREEGNHFQKSQAVRYCHQHRDVATFLTFICSIAIKNWPFGWNPIGVRSPSPFFRYPLKRRYGKIHQTI